MPEMDGPEAARRIVELVGPDKIKLIAISASVLRHEQESYREAGFDAFVSKPFRLEELCEVLSHVAGVSFEYDDSLKGDGQVNSLCDPSQVSLPSDLLKRMKTSAELYRTTELRKDIAVLRTDQPDQGSVVDHLERLNDEGDMEAILEFLGEIPNGG